MKLPYPKRDRYPKRLKINRTVWYLRIVGRVDREDSWGLCDPNTKTIYLKKNQKPGQMFATFYHEYLHALADEAGLSVAHRFIFCAEKTLPVILRIYLKGLK